MIVSEDIQTAERVTGTMHDNQTFPRRDKSFHRLLSHLTPAGTHVVKDKQVVRGKSVRV
jgi:hypothetical protein